MFTVTWNYADSTPIVQGGFATREDAEGFVHRVESSPHRQTHTNATITEDHEPTPDDLDAIASWSWSDYRAQIAEFGHIVNGERVFPALAGIVLALFLSITQLPAGCAITGHTSEGFPVATCNDGTTMYRDMDSAGGYNSGLPYVIPGTWVELS